METFRSDLSNKEFPLSEKVSGKTIRDSILVLIQQDYPRFSQESFMSLSELNYYREKYISGIMIEDTGELSDLEKNGIGFHNDQYNPDR